MVDLSGLSLHQCLCLLKDKEEISSTLNLGVVLKARLKKSLLTFTTTLSLLSAVGPVGRAEMPINDFSFMQRDQQKIREYYVGKQKLSREEYNDYINNAHLDSQCSCVPTHIQWQIYNNDLLHTCKLYLEVLEDERSFQWSRERELAMSTNVVVFSAGFLLIAWYSLYRDEEEAALRLLKKTFHHYF